MVKFFKIHKYSGLVAGVVLLLLGFTGFFLDHKGWSFLYDVTFSNVPKAALEKEKVLFESYYVNPGNDNHIITAGRRGAFESFDKGNSFTKTSNLQFFAIREYNGLLFGATNEGIYSKYVHMQEWKPFLLKNMIINSMNIYKNFLVASIDKKDIVLIDIKNRSIVNEGNAFIDSSYLNQDITLSRFVRDLHYGRGLFDGIASLLINDYGAIMLTLLPISGFLIWFLIKNIKNRSTSYTKNTRKIIKLHSNFFSIIAIVPLLILIITGIFLDHAMDLRNFMSSIKIPSTFLPPVYNSLKEDIWSVDYDGKSFRVGNRYGVYKSKNLYDWEIDSKGFAYRMIRKDERLYISGMGAPNRILQEGKYTMLKHSPHMFRDVFTLKGETSFISPHMMRFPLPKFQEATLYSVLLTMHDGTFFAPWWIWINDIASVLLVVLFITGFYRWKKRKRSLKVSA